MKTDNEPIVKGDLVVVIRGTPCCNNTRHLGKIFTVAGIMTNGDTKCSRCFKNLGDIDILCTERINNYAAGFARSMLKKVKPLSELESFEVTEEIGSPVEHGFNMVYNSLCGSWEHAKLLMLFHWKATPLLKSIIE